MVRMNRREMLGALAVGASLPARPLAAMQGVPLGELKKPVDMNALREKFQAGDPVDLRKLRDSRWSRDRAARYMEKIGVVKGVNYSTRFGPVFQEWNDRVRQAVLGSGVRPRIQFPSAELNEDVIRQELGWAQTVVGLNSIRLFLSIPQSQADRDAYCKKFERVLDIAASKGMTVMPVTGVSPARNPDAPAGEREPQLEFKPGVWGGGWRSPSTANINSDDTWPQRKQLVKSSLQAFLRRYAKDERIILWDLLNEPQTVQRPLVEYLFQWAREVDPSQPLSVCWNGHDLSDVINFHTYMQPGLSAPEGAPARVDFLTELEWARAWKRPILCTEWLARPFGNRVQNVLPFFSRYQIGWYSMGLCAGGPTQAQYPWNWPIGSPVPEEWFHCWLYPDGRPYKFEEILMVRDFKFQQPPEFVNTQSYWAYGDSVSEIKDVRPPLH